MLLVKIQDAVTKAVKSGDRKKATGLRTLLAALHNEKISRQQDLSDREVAQVLLRERKKREEALEIYRKAKREALAETEEQELKLIDEFLPPPMTDEELIRVIDMAIKEEGEKAHFGTLVKRVLEEVSGRVDGARVAKLLKEKLS